MLAHHHILPGILDSCDPLGPGMNATQKTGYTLRGLPSPHRQHPDGSHPEESVGGGFRDCVAECSRHDVVTADVSTPVIPSLSEPRRAECT